MLGKGLESLIPKKSEPASSAPHAPPAPAGQAAPPRVDDQSPRETRVPDRPTAEKVSRAPSRGAVESNAVFQIEVEKIKPNPLQPRREFHEESLKELADSIREFGIIQPLVVTKLEKEVPSGTEVAYELIAGERRLMAAKLLGLPRVPVIVKKIDAERERLEMAVIENLQREDLNPIERARAFARLQDEFRLTQREIATQLGKSRETVANTLRLLDLPTYIQDAVSKGEITESHGRLLLAVTDQAAQEKFFRDLVDRHLTTREVKNRLQGTKSNGEKGAAPLPAGRQISPELLSWQEKLSSELGAPVKIEKHGDSGKITITFYSGEELKNIVEKLGGQD